MNPLHDDDDAHIMEVEDSATATTPDEDGWGIMGHGPLRQPDRDHSQSDSPASSEPFRRSPFVGAPPRARNVAKSHRQFPGCIRNFIIFLFDE